MATNIIMPALEMAQETGVLVAWLKREGEAVTKGEALITVETDKVTVEIEATASGILGSILVHEGGEVPVGQTVGWILAPGESVPSAAPADAPMARSASTGSILAGNRPAPAQVPAVGADTRVETPPRYEASPLARNIAQENGIDLGSLKPSGKRIEKSDVIAAIRARELVSGIILASPKARRLASEQGLDLASIQGSGPQGAVLAQDVIAGEMADGHQPADVGIETHQREPGPAGSANSSKESISTVWKVMADRMSASWASVPHFYLTREVQASGLIEWRKRVAPVIEKRAGVKPTYTDLLVKVIGFTLKDHPRLNSAWANGEIQRNWEVNVGIATALDDGLIVPVIRAADSASIGEIATQRKDLIDRAQNKKLKPNDIANGTFTLSNLGMYNVDAFNAIINTPQAAILAVGRIAERVIALNGQAVVRPMLVLTLSCDHRVVDGARGAKFLDDLAHLIEDPWGLLT
jgi:pyruvate dehydrogenase E2 component (dihydrolipoamide acetyltransferase)